jgi:polyhydroxyalkanoate synthase
VTTSTQPSLASVEDLFDNPSAWDGGTLEALESQGGPLQALSRGFLPPRPISRTAEDGEEEPSIMGRLLAPPMRAADFAVEAAANLFDLTVGNSSTDPRPKPFSVIDDGPQRTVRRYEPRSRPLRGSILLLPPLAGPVSCFDLRPGVSMVEFFTWLGYRTYVVDYGPIGFSDRELGLEHWIDDVIPKTLRVSAEDAGEPVHTIGWCLGGIMGLLSLAADPDLPASTMSLVASPFDFEGVGLLKPIRQLGELTGGRIVTSIYQALGGIPAPLVSVGFRMTAIDRYLTRPLFVARNLDNREALVQMRATDRYMSRMLAYPGRSIGQLYHQFFFEGELTRGVVELEGKTIELAEVKVPVLAVGGKSDVLAPVKSVHHVAELLPNAASVRLEDAPGGHLGVLTGMGARRSTWAYLREFISAN